MPIKYHLETKPVRSRNWTPGASSLLDWEEGCLKCTVCVKTKCIYDVYKLRTIDPETFMDTSDALCKNCLQCVQNCPRRLINKAVSPEYKRMGDAYWTPDILSRIYYQAETGKIPVSGAGYGGPFTGPGFDAMWTDMSEIVRPTRDGIHGREYISTAVDLGRKPEFVEFSPENGLPVDKGRFVEAPTPFILGVADDRRFNDQVCLGLAAAARKMNAFIIVPAERLEAIPSETHPFVIPGLTRETIWTDADTYRQHRIAEVEYWDGVVDWLRDFRNGNAETVIMVRLPFSADSADRLTPLVQAGADILHLAASDHGLRPEAATTGVDSPFLKDLIREAHLKLVDAGLRDAVTLVVSGGLALAEHVAKAVVCGADATVLDLALWAALECRVCQGCMDRPECPAGFESMPADWAEDRIINLIGAWRNQLIEVLGAMGLREIRRLRGEVGRAMFFEQLEEETFAPIFGRRKV